jgi:hypothetical protein
LISLIEISPAIRAILIPRSISPVSIINHPTLLDN